MAMSGGSDDGAPMMEMNTTPLIDVMLVLLIMFIITIPPSTHAVDIDLPISDPNNVNPPDIDPVKNKLSVTVNGEITWNGTVVTRDNLINYLRKTKGMSPSPELQFQPEPNAGYEIVDRVLVVIRRSGVSNFGFVGNEYFGTFGKADNPPS
mgnify:CR=1 FL=1